MIEPSAAFKTTKINSQIILQVNQASTNSSFVFTTKGGKKVRIITLSSQQALDTWKATIAGKEYLLISNSDLVINKDNITLQNTEKTSASLTVFPTNNSLNLSNQKNVVNKQDGIFSVYTFNFSPKKLAVDWKEDVTLNKAAKAITTDTAKTISYPLYGASLQPIASAKYYTINIPKNSLQGLSNAFLKIDYEGDTQGAYLNGKLVADDFYDGFPMTIGLNQLPDSADGKTLSLVVTPLKDASKIYFEDGIREPLIGKDKAQINNISLIPQHSTIITGFVTKNELNKKIKN
jgi:hypothetical protein